MADSILNANIPIYGKIGNKMVDLNRAHMVRGQAYSRRLYPLKESAAQKFFASELPEHGSHQESFPNLAEIQKKRNEYEDWWKNAKLSSTYSKVSGSVLADRIAIAKSDASTLERLRGEAYAEGDSIYETRKARSAIAQERRRREHLSRMHISRPSETENRVHQTNVAKGVEKALGGGKVMRTMRQLFGYNFGWAHLARAFGKFIIGNSLRAASRVTSTNLSALATGTSFNSLYGLGGALRVFGGNEQNATQMYASINRFRSGALMGNGMGALGNLFKYGVRISPFMSEDQILNQIAEAYKNVGITRGAGFQAMFAEEAGISPAMQKMMAGGAAGFREQLEKYSPHLTEGQQKLLDEQGKAQRELGVVWERLMNEIAVDLIPILKMITSYLRAMYGEKAYSHELESFKAKNPSASNLDVARHMQKIGFGDLIPKTTRVAGDPHGGYGIVGKLFNFRGDIQTVNPIYTAYKSLNESNNVGGIPTSAYMMPGSFGGSTYNISISPLTDTQKLTDDISEVIRKNDHDSVINLFSKASGATYSITK